MDQNIEFPDFEGNFTLENLICHLFRNDISPSPNKDLRSSDRSSIEEVLNDYAATMVKIGLAYASMSRVDQFSFKRLGALSSEAAARLFHERVHFWQVISSPRLQSRFLYVLDKLNNGVLKRHGRSGMICGINMLAGEIPDDTLESSLKKLDLSINPPPSSKNLKFMQSSQISEEPFIDMPFVYLTSPDGERVPGYGVVMDLESEKGTIIFPIVGHYLLESAAYVAETLYAGRPLPSPSNKEVMKNVAYLGPWEFWRRVHRQHYKTESDLALSFLAAVDLTMTADIINPQILDEDNEHEIFSLSYRFGKIAWHSRHIEPLTCTENKDWGKSVIKYQEEICSYIGWASPTLSAKKMAALLTKLMFASCAKNMKNTPSNEKLALWLVDTEEEEIAENFDALVPMWELIAKAIKEFYVQHHWPLGQKLLGTMLNACVYRANNPGHFAAPHLYAKNLGERFPLPLVMFEGQNYFDEDPGTSIDEGWPCPVYPIDSMTDCMGLISLLPLSEKRTQCGFVEQVLDCNVSYIKDLGCPQKSLTKAQKEERKKSGLENVCYWKLLMKDLNLQK